ncbi:MAG TPA: CsbD family protein [Paraburkholderia sp.]|nr:CsbD family protein [Paraburkholderia sp.]
METSKTEGVIREAVGSAQDALGGALGDAGMQMSGKARELCGKAQQLCADTAAIARDSMVEKPLTTLAVTAAVGFVVGALWSWNHGDSDARR